MAVLADYLHWRGDLSFEQAPFCALDAAILTQVSYIDLRRAKRAYTKREPVAPMTLADAITTLLDDIKNSNEPLSNFTCSFADPPIDFYRELAKSPRFSHIIVRKIIEERGDADTYGIQFFACVLDADKNFRFISFRGSDLSFSAWREDFKLCFSITESEAFGALLVTSWLADARDAGFKACYLGGHSKGGLVAAYSGAQLSEQLFSYLTRIYAFDSPDLHPSLMQPRLGERLGTKFVKYVPHYAVVGLIMADPDISLHIVQCTAQNPFSHHNLLKWSVDVSDFAEVDDVDESALRWSRAMELWIDSMSQEEGIEATDTLFDLLSETDSDDMLGLLSPATIKEIFDKRKRIDEKSRVHILDLLKILIGFEKSTTQNQSILARERDKHELR